MKAWNIKQLKEAMDNDLTLCRTNHERLMVQVICVKEIKGFAAELQKERKLTPIEQAIVDYL